MNKYYLPLLIIISCLIRPALAQQEIMDSLQNVLVSNTKLSPSDKIELLNNLIEYTEDYEEAEEYTKEILKIAQENSLKVEEAYALEYLGDINKDLSRFSKAEGFYQQAIRLYYQLNDQVRLGYTFNGLGLVHFHQSNYDKAQEYFEKSLEVFQKN